MGTTIRLTTAQAIVQFIKMQFIKDGEEIRPFVKGMWGIFGHGNVAGMGQALEEEQERPIFDKDRRLTYYQARNEQAMVHAAVAYAKQKRRKGIFACTSSIGPGATNMITAAAGATINRLPVLLLPGDTFARRNVDPVLQQLEHPNSPDMTVNDCFRPISRYFDRITRPEQILNSLPQAFKILLSPEQTGAVVIALPQDVQAEAFDFPIEFFQKRIHRIHRPLPDSALIDEASTLIQKAKCPMIIAGGGVLYSEAENILKSFCETTAIPLGETQAGKGVLPYNHHLNLGSIGVTGSEAANKIAQQSDLIINVGTRLSDFTTASKSIFLNKEVKFININISETDVFKQNALPLLGDASRILAQLKQRMTTLKFRVNSNYQSIYMNEKEKWHTVHQKLLNGHWWTDKSPLTLAQGQVIKLVSDQMDENDTVIGAAGSLPGDMHKLWPTKNAQQYHMEYGYSCMGYEIAGGLGTKLAKDTGDVFVMVGDGSFLMMNTEILTSIQENKKLIIIIIENHKFASIHGLGISLGSEGFGNEFRKRSSQTGKLEGDFLEIDFMKNAQSFGANSYRATTPEELTAALIHAKRDTKTSVIVTAVNPEFKVPNFSSWWDVPIAEVSQLNKVRQAREDYEEKLSSERYF